MHSTLIQRQHVRGSRLLACLVLAAVLHGGRSLAQGVKLSLVTAATLPPLVASELQPGFLNMLAAEAFKRIGIQVNLTTLPAQRALINVNNGIDDGDVFRAPGLERDYPNLIRVPEPVLVHEFVAYSGKAGVSIRDWDDLKHFSVAYASGYRIFELNVRDTKELTVTPSIFELFTLLEKDRVDVILLDRWSGQSVIRQKNYQFKPLEPPLAQTNMFMYLNKKHAALVPKVAQALRGMKADGSYKKIFDATLKPLDTR
jgi:polar amino acid transport system substrate-binding protein